MSRDGLAYHQVLRLGRAEGGWAALGIFSMTILFFVVQVAVVVPFIVYLLIDGLTAQQALDRLTGDPVTPMFLLMVNLGLAATIPAAWLVIRTCHGLRPRWLASVAPGIRWKWLGVCFGLAVVALFATLLVSLVVPTDATGSEMAGLNDFTRQTRDFLIIVVLLTPLQAAAEEYVFRGYLTQAFGRLLGRVAAVLLPALIFAIAHGIGQDLPIFFDRFAFGVVAGIAVVATGGLEAGIAMHVLNNLLAFGLALAFGDMTEALNPMGGSWWNIVVTMTQSAVFLGLVLWTAQRLGIQTRTAPEQPTELVAPEARV